MSSSGSLTIPSPPSTSESPSVALTVRVGRELLPWWAVLPAGQLPMAAGLHHLLHRDYKVFWCPLILIACVSGCM